MALKMDAMKGGEHCHGQQDAILMVKASFTSSVSCHDDEDGTISKTSQLEENVVRRTTFDKTSSNASRSGDRIDEPFVSKHSVAWTVLKTEDRKEEETLVFTPCTRQKEKKSVTTPKKRAPHGLTTEVHVLSPGRASATDSFADKTTTSVSIASKLTSLRHESKCCATADSSCGMSSITFDSFVWNQDSPSSRTSSSLSNSLAIEPPSTSEMRFETVAAQESNENLERSDDAIATIKSTMIETRSDSQDEGLCIPRRHSSVDVLPDDLSYEEHGVLVNDSDAPIKGSYHNVNRDTCHTRRMGNLTSEDEDGHDSCSSRSTRPSNSPAINRRTPKTGSFSDQILPPPLARGNTERRASQPLTPPADCSPKLPTRRNSGEHAKLAGPKNENDSSLDDESLTENSLDSDAEDVTNDDQYVTDVSEHVVTLRDCEDHYDGAAEEATTAALNSLPIRRAKAPTTEAPRRRRSHEDRPPERPSRSLPFHQRQLRSRSLEDFRADKLPSQPLCKNLVKCSCDVVMSPPVKPTRRRSILADEHSPVETLSAAVQFHPLSAAEDFLGIANLATNHDRIQSSVYVPVVPTRLESMACDAASSNDADDQKDRLAFVVYQNDDERPRRRRSFDAPVAPCRRRSMEYTRAPKTANTDGNNEIPRKRDPDSMVAPARRLPMNTNNFADAFFPISSPPIKPNPLFPVLSSNAKKSDKRTLASLSRSNSHCDCEEQRLVLAYLEKSLADFNVHVTSPLRSASAAVQPRISERQSPTENGTEEVSSFGTAMLSPVSATRGIQPPCMPQRRTTIDDFSESFVKSPSFMPRVSRILPPRMPKRQMTNDYDATSLLSSPSTSMASPLNAISQPPRLPKRQITIDADSVLDSPPSKTSQECSCDEN